MPGMAPYVPTPKGDKFKAGDTVQWREDSLLGTAYRVGQLWSRAENSVARVERYGYMGQREIRHQGKFWFVVRENGEAHLLNERDLTHVMSREEQRVLI